MRGFCSLASGSKGNCIYIGTEQTKILIDAGISAKKIEEGLLKIGVNIEEIDAILISHEHSDHMKGVDALFTKYHIPIFANAETAKAVRSLVKNPIKFKIFSTGETFEFGDLEIHPFSVQHDTADPVMFTIKTDQVKIGVCTDLGFPTTLVKSHLQYCDHLFIESNHEPSMVYACKRPNIYKQRVLGRQGHLSNAECSLLLEEISHAELKTVYLAHLSEECNHPELALKMAKAKLPKEVDVNIAEQHAISKIIYI